MAANIFGRWPISRVVAKPPGADLATSKLASATTSTNSASSTGGSPRPGSLPDQAPWSVVDPFGNVLGIMDSRRYLDILANREAAL
jgi:hypothetical protein